MLGRSRYKSSSSLMSPLPLMKQNDAHFPSRKDHSPSSMANIAPNFNIFVSHQLLFENFLTWRRFNSHRNTREDVLGIGELEVPIALGLMISTKFPPSKGCRSRS